MKTVFIRAIEAPVDEKAAVIRAAVHGLGTARYDADTRSFGQIPRSPFAYWTSEPIREAFRRFAPLESSRVNARQGGVPGDDFRRLRLAWEITTNEHRGWVSYAKGGKYSPFYSDLELVIQWDRGRRSFHAFTGLPHRPSLQPASCDFYFRPGITWPRRTNGLSFRVMPAGCIFADKGPAAFVEGNDPGELLALCAALNSSVFGALVAVQLARTELAQSFEVGLIQQTPVPKFGAEGANCLTALALRSWSLKRHLDTRTENSHAFHLPALLQADGAALSDRAQAWAERAATIQGELDALDAEIDNHTYRLYGISDEDRRRIAQGFGTSGEAEENPADDDLDESDDDGDVAEVDAMPMVASLLSWTLGVAFGRFDVRLAIGDRDAPPEPEPFDPLPVCSPGMLTGDDGLPVVAPPSGYPLTFPTDGILVDDPGHPRDVVRAVRSVFEAVFDDANARWHEAVELLGTPDLRFWFAHDFFEPHIKRYSKSRRKAPIYWQLATASGSYSVWLYIHRATGDTLFRVLNEFVGPKLDHEKAKLDGLTQEAGGNPSAAQRREIERQETFAGELQALKTEVARVAPLWKPNLDDGVILNFAPLWRLVPQSRSWQGECKKAWDKLVAGDYDWAHLAMHLWPERVVPKCQDDRSLAIAHGLEDVFWHEDDSGTWRKSRVDDATVQTLIRERTSTTVKAALKDLLSAAAPTASKGRKAKGRSASRRTSAPKPAPAAARATTPDTVLDEATLRAVKTAIASVAEGASKADVLAATGLSDGDWNKAIAALLDRGDVTRTGQKRGTRYHADSPGEDG
jgi:hypothetical protein